MKNETILPNELQFLTAYIRFLTGKRSHRPLGANENITNARRDELIRRAEHIVR